MCKTIAHLTAVCCELGETVLGIEYASAQLNDLTVYQSRESGSAKRLKLALAYAYLMQGMWLIFTQPTASGYASLKRDIRQGFEKAHELFKVLAQSYENASALSREILSKQREGNSEKQGTGGLPREYNASMLVISARIPYLALTSSVSLAPSLAGATGYSVRYGSVIVSAWPNNPHQADQSRRSSDCQLVFRMTDEATVFSSHELQGRLNGS